MKKRGAEMIVLASCITEGAPSSNGYPCPFANKLKIIEEKVQLKTIRLDSLKKTYKATSKKSFLQFDFDKKSRANENKKIKSIKEWRQKLICLIDFLFSYH